MLTALDKINYLNIVLMILSVVMACTMPLEVFLGAYAFLGPAHYLTEISWLHDRGYFTTGKRDWAWLLLSVGVIVVNQLYSYDYDREVFRFAITATFLLAGVFAFWKPGPKKKKYGFAALGLAVLCLTFSMESARFLAIFLPTLIHVYVFTGLFILYGALKSKSFSGLLSLAVFIACAPLTFAIDLTGGNYAPSQYFADASDTFSGLRSSLISLLGLTENQETTMMALRFFAFCYSYHYLNWFSKTQVINWHRISRRRLAIICAAYLVSIGTYLIDFRLGFALLVALSFGHVVLEFPLNFKSAEGIVRIFYSETIGRFIKRPA